MTVATFDTLKYANTLKAVGVPDKQAEAQATVLAEALSVNLKDLVTKDDLKQALVETEQRVNARIDLVRSDLSSEIGLVRSDLSSEISLVRSELRSEIGLVRSDLGSEIGLLRSEMRSEIGLVRSEIDLVRSDLGGDIKLLKWMMGVLITICSAMLVRLFFFRMS